MLQQTQRDVKRTWECRKSGASENWKCPSKDMSMSFSRTSSSDVALCLLKLPIVVCNKLPTFENYVGWCWLEFKLAYIVQHCWLAASLASSEQAFTQTQRDVIVDVVDQPSFPKTWEQPCRQSKNCTHFRRFNYGNGWMKNENNSVTIADIVLQHSCR